MAREIRANNPLRRAVGQLAHLYEQAEPHTDPLAIILWENIGYLIDDDRRRKLFEEFRSRVGFDAAAIARAPETILLDIAKRGGMNPLARVERWRQIAEIILAECGGDLATHLRSLPVRRARAVLKKFPSIGDPGADRLLLFCDLDARPSVDSNGLRVLVRFGCVPDKGSYAATYKAAVSVLAGSLPGGRETLISTYMALRQHGRNLCKRAAPLCMACPLDKACAHTLAKGF